MKKEIKIGVAIAAILLLSVFGTTIANASPVIVPDDYAQIQWAVNNATAGDTIIVRDGTYVENIVVNERFTIKSENGSSLTTVQAANSNDHVFYITADYVNISGFTVKGATNKSGIYGEWVKHCNITNNNASNNYYGIHLYNSDRNIITNNNASNNYYGIRLYRYSDSNKITNNIASYNDYGIYLYKSDRNKIMNNIASYNDRGIYLCGGSLLNTITNNIASYNDRGIYLCGGSGSNTITNNTASCNDYYGIYLGWSDFNTITNNTASDNGWGIYLYYSRNNKVYLNNFIDNTDNVHSVDIIPSTIIWNSAKLITYIYNGTTYTNYMGNYWDDYGGIDADGDGIGDTPYIIDSNDKDNYPLTEPWENYFAPTENIFDTGAPVNPYPSIMGIHNGTIKPNQTITVSRLYTYPCAGTGGHSELVWIYGNGINVNATWNGYQGAGDYHYIEFSEPFTLEANVTYNYMIKTGSYPQIIHERIANATAGIISCTEFIDANRKRYYNWIPAIRLE